MSEDGRVPQTLDSDSEDVAWALSTAHVMWTRGERLDAIKWVRRASDQAAEAGDDDRAFALARAAADLKDVVSPSLPPPPPPRSPLRSSPPTSGNTPSGGTNRTELPGPPRLPSAPSLGQPPSVPKLASATATLVPTRGAPPPARFDAPLPTAGSRPPPPNRRPPSNSPPGRTASGRPPPLPARGSVRMPPAPLQPRPATPANHTPALGRPAPGATTSERPIPRPLAVQYSGDAGRTVPGIGYFSSASSTAERTPTAEAPAPTAVTPAPAPVAPAPDASMPATSPIDAPSAASIERELSSLTSTVETPAPDVEALAASPSSRRGAEAAVGPSSEPQAASVPAPSTPAKAPGEGSFREVPPSPPTPRVDALGISVEALRAWLVPAPDGPRIVIWSPYRPPGAIEVVVLATQAGVNLRTLLS